MFLINLVSNLGSYMLRPRTGTVVVVCHTLNFLIWLSLMRYSSLSTFSFIDFFGLSFSGGYFANIAIFSRVDGTLYEFIVLGDEFLFLSGSSIFKGLEWYEREAYDLCGCFFEDSADKRALLLPYCCNMHPLQKTQYVAIGSKIKGSTLLSFITWCNL